MATATATAGTAPGDTGATQPSRLPPGPRLPRWAQTIGFILFGARFLEEVHRRFGDAATMQTLFDDRFVLVFSPELVRRLFQGSATQMHAGEANVLLGPIVGERSILLLDEEEHLRHRRLMSPPFHGGQLRGWMDTMRTCADAEIDRWPVGETFPILPRMHDLTLRVMLRAVFGYGPGAAADELAARLRAMIEPLSRRSGLLTVSAMNRTPPTRRRSRAARRFAARTRAVDELLYAEIARRRADPDLAQRTDVFSALLLARGEDDGTGLTDAEVRDELLTLLLAGHETTATGLAWTFDLLLHEPRVLARAREDPDDDDYLDAIVREALRRRPVIPSIGRVVRGASPSASSARVRPTSTRGSRSAAGHGAVWARALPRPRCASCCARCCGAPPCGRPTAVTRGRTCARSPSPRTPASVCSRIARRRL